VVCSVASREPPIYRIERGWRGSGKVDHGAASPAAGRARRGRCRVLLVQAKLEVVLVWSGDVWSGRIASTTAAARTGCGRRLRRRWSRVGTGRVSGAAEVSRWCAWRRQGVQGVSREAARRVASARPWRAWSRRERHPGPVWARVVRALSSSSSTRAVLGGARVAWW
jgi:hypothetical protein